MFGYNTQGKNIRLLEDFLNSLSLMKPKSPVHPSDQDFTPYLVDKRVQEFFKIEDSALK